MADYLATVMDKKYGGDTLAIFDPCYQDLAKDVIRINGIPTTEEEKDLEDVLGEELDWL